MNGRGRTATPHERCAGTSFLLRPWAPTDASLMSEAVVASYDHLRPWMDWAVAEQTPEASEEIIRGFMAGWDAREDFVIAILAPDESRALGGTGFHLRGGAIGEEAEIGMWIRADRAAAGLGTAVLGALLDWGFGDWGWRRLTWKCDTDNHASRRVAEKCGMRLEGTLREDRRTPAGGLRDTHLYAKLAREHAPGRR